MKETSLWINHSAAPSVSPSFQHQVLSRVGGCYESSLAAANILLCTELNQKVPKKYVKVPGTVSALNSKICYYGFPYSSRSVNRGSPKF